MKRPPTGRPHVTSRRRLDVGGYWSQIERRALFVNFRFKISRFVHLGCGHLKVLGWAACRMSPRPPVRSIGSILLMQRWMHSAAGGTSQRLKPAVAIVRSRSRMLPSKPRIVPSSSIVAIVVSSKPAALVDMLPRLQSCCLASFPCI
jgi:hypothetical protein